LTVSFLDLPQESASRNLGIFAARNSLKRGIKNTVTLIKSISGIRGTIGGKAGSNLTPEDVVKFTAAFGTWLKKNSKADP
jgi:hypothetical protein